MKQISLLSSYRIPCRKCLKWTRTLVIGWQSIQSITDACALGLNHSTLNDPDEKLFYFGKQVCDRPNMTSYTNAMIKQFEGLIRFFGFRTHFKRVTEYFLQILLRKNNNEKRHIELKNTKMNSELMTLDEISAQAYGWIYFDIVHFDLLLAWTFNAKSKIYPK